MKQTAILLFTLASTSLALAQSNRLQEGNICFTKGDYACAIEKYKEAIQLPDERQKKIASDNLRQAEKCFELREMADVAFNSKNFIKAKEYYQSLLNENTKDQYAKEQIAKCIEFSIVKAKIPEKITGKMERCFGDSELETYTLSGSDLGSEAKFWRLFEDGKEVRRFIKDTLRLAPTRTTKYRIAAENNNENFFEFEIKINQPPMLAGSIDGNGMVCPGKQFTLKFNNLNSIEEFTLNWYKTDATNKTKKFVGSGTQIADAIYTNTSYEVEGIIKGCSSDRKLGKSVAIINTPSTPILGKPVINGSTSQKADLFITTAINDKIEYEWSLDGFNSIYSKGQSLKGLKLNKGANKVYVRAINECGTPSRVAEQDIVRAKTGYFFMNIGGVINDLENLKTAMVTLGGRGIYFRAKFTPSLLFNEDAVSTSFSNRELEVTNAGKVTNFPPSTGYYYSINGMYQSNRQGVTAGTNFGGKTLRIYLGGGYGERTMFWNLNLVPYSQDGQSSNVYAKNAEQSWKGIEGEAGLLLKLGKFNLMGGTSLIFDSNHNEPFIDIHLGIGFSTR